MLLLVGCVVGCAPGSVDLDELDDFGRVGSALWLRLDDGGDTLETILLSTSPRSCAAVQGDLTGFVELQDDNGSMEIDEYYLAQAERMEPYMGAGAGLIYLTFYSVDGDGHLEPGEYSVNSEADAFDLTLVEYLRNPFDAAAEAASDDGDVSAAMTAAADRWLLASGEAVLTAQGDGELEGEVSGELEAWEGGAAGALDAAFTAGYCEVAVSPGIIFTLLY